MRTSLAGLLALLTVLGWPASVRGRSGDPDAKRLYDDLLSNYNKVVRPVVNNSDVLMVRIKLKLSQLIDLVNIGFSLTADGLLIFDSACDRWRSHPFLGSGLKLEKKKKKKRSHRPQPFQSMNNERHGHRYRRSDVIAGHYSVGRCLKRRSKNNTPPPHPTTPRHSSRTPTQKEKRNVRNKGTHTQNKRRTETGRVVSSRRRALFAKPAPFFLSPMQTKRPGRPKK